MGPWTVGLLLSLIGAGYGVGIITTTLYIKGVDNERGELQISILKIMGVASCLIGILVIYLVLSLPHGGVLGWCFAILWFGGFVFGRKQAIDSSRIRHRGRSPQKNN